MNNSFGPAVFLTGELVYLRTPDIEKDVISGKWHSWFNDKTTTKYLGQGIYPNTVEKQVDFVNSLKNDKSRVVLCIVDKSNDTHIGVVSFNDIDYINRKAYIAIVIGEESYPAGAPLEALALMAEYGFDRLNLNKIMSGQVADLWKWANTVELIGFRIEGYNKSVIIRDGHIYDAVSLGLTAERFLKLREARGGNICLSNITELVKKRRKDNLAILIRDYIDNLYK